ncbi:carboxypeptidase-like regulatory domain-containing protein [Soonwooa sp.]|uniref:carboxypeptidase-like regulatory domain-containing protein n=1 Tax=Soonwooa sp. TaxID=1938592 RepID=UPI0026287F29|nr:carboxypeptidase-like regulatory domain-containing protein [Soonwooa sp.]
MRKIFYLTFSLLLASCSQVNNFYQGRVVDENGKALENVIVAEDVITKQTKTDKTGYFKLNRTPDWLGNLIFIKEGFVTDTIPSVYHQNGETTKYDFIKKDTTRVTLRRVEDVKN